MKHLNGWATAAVVLSLASPLMAVAQSSTSDEIAKYRQMLADGNPAELWEARGEGLWKTKAGSKNASLEQCDLGKGPGVVKGAYAEPESVAFKSREESDANYIHLMRLLLDGGNFPAIATHDPALVTATQIYAKGRDIPSDRFEFQMLYGVRRDEQQRLKDAGFGMRVYVPYGTEWYPYFTRRIAERPANALFVVRQLRG